jgi:hypothetical protein
VRSLATNIAEGDRKIQSSAGSWRSKSRKVGREIEFEGARLGLSDVINKINGLAADLIENGMVINDGDSVGASEKEPLKAIYTTSKRFSGWPVLLVTSAVGAGEASS